jgi:hypothetical protein
MTCHTHPAPLMFLDEIRVAQWKWAGIDLENIYFL